jgi:eukaryotic-like serine/threonine-protein kinase
LVCPSCKNATRDQDPRCTNCGANLELFDPEATLLAGQPDDLETVTPGSGDRTTQAFSAPPQSALPQAGDDESTRIQPTRIEQGSPASGPSATGPSGPHHPGWSTFLSPVETGAGPLSLDAGSVLAGRYRIIRSLGEGGMGAVYKAHDLEVDRLVAIKVIRPELACDPQILQRFKQELVLARQVTHRNVVRIFDIGAAENLKFISMEFIEGRELAALLEDAGKLPPKQAVEIMLQVCRGLEVAHSEGVIHRDLKPQNIMIDSQGRAAVMDFGIAHSLGATVSAPPSEAVTAPNAAAGLTMVGSLLGTPRYMSPEQARCEAVDARSDVFTVGLILYELLTGITPFRGKTGKETLRKRIEETAKPPIELDPRIPKVLNQIVLKCLEREPSKRYASAGELVHDLEGWLGIGSAGRAKQVRRMKWMAGGMAALLIGASGFIVWNQMNTRANKPHPLVKLLISDFANRTGDPHLNGTLEPMFQVALERSSFITSYNRGAARKIGAELKPGLQTMDEAVARLVALREGLGIVVSGAIEKHDNGYRLLAKAENTAKGDTLIEKDADIADARDLPGAVEKLSERIRRALGDVKSSKTAAAETFSSASLEAAQRYSQAQDLQWSGKWEDSIAAYRKAVAIDPNLSRAYSGLAATLANRGQRQEAEKYYQLALSHISSMSDREKYRTRGGYFLLTRDYKKAAEQFKELVSQYPADTAGIANLALAYFYERNMPLALQEGQRAIEIYPNNLLQRNNIGLYAMYAGDFDRAISESNEILKLNPSFEKAYLCLGIAQLGKGQVDESKAAYQKMAGLSEWGASEAALGLADLAVYQGHLTEAAGLLQEGIEKDLQDKDVVAAAKKAIVLASLQLEKRQRAAALQTAENAAQSNDDESVLFPAAEVYIDAGETAKALAIAAKLSARFGPEPRAEAKLIEGEAQLKQGKIRAAIGSIEEAQKLSDTWLGRFALGRAYLAANMYPDADGEFDVCLRRRGEATAVFLDDDPSLRYLPAAFYYQGRAREGLNSPGAAESYRTYIGMRSGAENDALLVDAKRRLKQ